MLLSPSSTSDYEESNLHIADGEMIGKAAKVDQQRPPTPPSLAPSSNVFNAEDEAGGVKFIDSQQKMRTSGTVAVADWMKPFDPLPHIYSKFLDVGWKFWGIMDGVGTSSMVVHGRLKLTFIN
jgi:hypothetical protein